MKPRNISYTASLILSVTLAVFIQACSTEIGGNEDRTPGAVVLTSLNEGGEIIGDFNITWDNTETNRSTVDIALSNDSGQNYSTVIQLDAPDSGVYIWDTNTVADCRQCRIRVTATDVVGNTSAPAESSQDFIINNVPQVLGAAYYQDNMPPGPSSGDAIRVPFDKELVLLTSIASDIFFIPVTGDSVGPFATVAKSIKPNELVITFDKVSLPEDANYHVHVNNRFDPARLKRTAPSGLNLLDNLAEGILLATDTGRTAQPASNGIDLAPAFGDSGQALGLASTNSVALGDVDGDGDLDLVEGNNGETLLRLNDGAGNFNDPGQALATGSTNPVLLGDVDGDDDLDLVVGNNTTSQVWLNGGDNSGSNTGVFADSGQTLGGFSANRAGLALGDVDSDGDLDIVTGNDAGSSITVWLNGGDNTGSNTGIYTDSGQSLGNLNTSTMQLIDVDGDADLDLVKGASLNSGNSAWLNDGAGNFTDSGLLLRNGVSLVSGDLDGDGDLDIVLSGDRPLNTSIANTVWRNDGAGNFTDTGQGLGTGGVLALADVDGDGDLDLIGGKSGIGELAANFVWLNGGDDSGSNTGVFTDSGQALGVSATRAIALGDVDADGDLDLVAGNAAEANRVWLNSLHIRGQIFIEQPLPTTANSAFWDLGDVDNDGDDDMVISTGASVQLWLSDGDGGFTDTGQSLGGGFMTGAHDVVLGDIDGDNDLDLITAITSDTVEAIFQVRRNDGSGKYSFSNQVSQFNGGSSTVALGDIDGDGDLDMVTENAAGNLVWRNDGIGNFTDSGQNLGTNGVLILGDVDNDDDLDIVIGKNGANQVWLNGGDNSGSNTGVFVDTLQSLGTGSTQSVVLGDIDGDGDLDMLTGNDNAEANLVWRNDGAGNFSYSGLTTHTLGANNTRSVVLGDIDSDGDLDMVAGNATGNTVWLNNGAGNFIDSGQRMDTGNTQSVALADIDGDADLDIVEVNSGNNRLWLNDY